MSELVGQTFYVKCYPLHDEIIHVYVNAFFIHLCLQLVVYNKEMNVGWYKVADVSKIALWFKFHAFARNVHVSIIGYWLR